MAWAGMGLPRCGERQRADAQRFDSGERLAAGESQRDRSSARRSGYSTTMASEFRAAEFTDRGFDDLNFLFGQVIEFVD
jgi:hypothetical protein